MAMKQRKQNLLRNVLLGTSALLLYSLRHRFPEIGDVKDRVSGSYQTASRRIRRASDVLRGQGHLTANTTAALLVGVGVGIGVGVLVSPAKGGKIRANISEKVKEFRDKVRDRSSREPKGATGTYGE